MGAQSSIKMLPEGGHQGAYLGGLIFIIKYNGAFLRPPVPRNIPGPVSKSKSEKVKFVDDGTVAVSIDLKTCLIPDPVDRARPGNYHEWTSHVLPEQNNLLNFYIRDSEQFVSENLMVLNKKKTRLSVLQNLESGIFRPKCVF